MAKRRRKQVKYKTRRRHVIPAVLAALLLITAAGALVLYLNTPAKRLARALNAGTKHLSEGSYTQALSDYEKALEADPLSGDAYTGLIRAQGALGNAQGVYDAFAQANGNPDFTEKEAVRTEASSRLYAIGESFFSGGDYDDARTTAALLTDVDEARATELSGKIVDATAPPVGSTYVVGTLEYRVLERQGSDVLLYAEKAVDTRPFTETQIGVPWGNSTLRTWLNKTWVDTLDPADAASIVATTIENPAYPNDPESRAHGSTEDRVFLLSVTELLQYFPAESDRAAGYPYWTRTGTGRSDTKAVCVTESGAFTANDVRDAEAGVRIAFWYRLH